MLFKEPELFSPFSLSVDMPLGKEAICLDLCSISTLVELKAMII